MSCFQQVEYGGSDSTSFPRLGHEITAASTLAFCLSISVCLCLSHHLLWGSQLPVHEQPFGEAQWQELKTPAYSHFTELRSTFSRPFITSAPANDFIVASLETLNQNYPAKILLVPEPQKLCETPNTCFTQLSVIL